MILKISDAVGVGVLGGALGLQALHLQGFTGFRVEGLGFRAL